MCLASRLLESHKGLLENTNQSPSGVSPARESPARESLPVGTLDGRLQNAFDSFDAALTRGEWELNVVSEGPWGGLQEGNKTLAKIGERIEDHTPRLVTPEGVGGFICFHFN